MRNVIDYYVWLQIISGTTITGLPLLRDPCLIKHFSIYFLLFSSLYHVIGEDNKIK